MQLIKKGRSSAARQISSNVSRPQGALSESCPNFERAVGAGSSGGVIAHRPPIAPTLHLTAARTFHISTSDEPLRISHRGRVLCSSAAMVVGQFPLAAGTQSATPPRGERSCKYSLPSGGLAGESEPRTVFPTQRAENSSRRTHATPLACIHYITTSSLPVPGPATLCSC